MLITVVLAQNLSQEVSSLRPYTLKFISKLNRVPVVHCCFGKVSRCNVYEDVLKLYEDDAILLECPLNIEFEGEIGVDAGGVTRDMFFAFWDSCCATLFDGSMLQVPMIFPQMDTSLLSRMGRILSHGYLVSGFIPVRIALPCLLVVFCGPSVEIPQSVLQEAFLDFVSGAERLLFKDALSSSVFLPETKEKLLNTLSRFGCRQVPTPANLHICFQQVAQFESVVSQQQHYQSCIQASLVARVHNKEKRVSNVHSALNKIIPESHALGMFIKCGRWRQEKTNRVIFCTLHSYSEIASSIESVFFHSS